ncbi:uncharacterized protein M421DRAFT_4333 [Didymella exigua CBS 183.55]|uniref:Biogenesis of lysosome-related organelles complex 1 subunit 1 n=1 Tax=Didymella exigua CBS 183.55 TaxID=1150837 RepID=A0A6A5RUX8_9PLEO|nr:uncharacterized protein M421DRAFT_4333 [Didymella exigua CBS 183.55]KAF1929157.1 hypothetical protein M421DRAFT_4333 [Didymella exigua CBS 183.55]
MSSSPTAATVQQQREARAAVLASLSSIGTSIDTDLRTRTADLHANSAAIAKQEKELARQTAALRKESDKWQKLGDTSTKKLNELGDVQNWAEMLERDLLVLEETVRLVDEGRSGRETGEQRGYGQPR